MSVDFDNISKNKVSRIYASKLDNRVFFGIYFRHYLKLKSAPFHKELFGLIKDDSIRNLVIVAFRGSAKSTIITTSFPIWSILNNNIKFILVLGKTEKQARQHLINIRRELEENRLLKEDYSYSISDKEWNNRCILIPEYDAKIMAVSMEQSIRGIRHKSNRPQIIICDDIEDTESVRTMESRNKMFDWITGEIIPTGDINTRMIFVGNLLHRDSLLMRMKDKLELNEIDGIYKEIKLMEDDGTINWLSKYPNTDAIEFERRKVFNDRIFEREYMLKIVPDDDAIIEPEWIHYYDEITHRDGQFLTYITGVDPAISQRDTADYTGIVTIKCYQEDVGEYGHKNIIYVMPEIINKKMKFPETIQTLKDIKENNERRTKIIIENNGYQQAIEQQLKKDGVDGVVSYSLGGKDKRTRLNMISNHIKEGIIRFPKGCNKELINQILDFGSTKHDDLVDALTIACIYFITEYKGPPRIYIID